MIVLILLLVFELYLLNRILKYFLLSPIYLYVTFSLVSIVLTVGYFYFFENKFSLFSLDKVSEIAFLSTIKMYLTALITFIFGVIVFYDLSTKKVKSFFNRSYTSSLFFTYTLPKRTKNITGIIFFIIIALYFITYGKGIFIRNVYLPETSRSLTIIIKILSFIEILLLGLIYREKKILSTLYFIFLMIISIGTGSRSVFLFFILYVVLVFISNGNTLLNKVRFSIHLIISFIFLAYIMQLRQLGLHGVIPYLKSIGSSQGDFYRSFLFNIYYSFVYGVFVTIRTIQEAKLDWHIILVNINPLPGKLAGWYTYAQDMRINKFVPYSLHGRVFKTGLPFTIIYFFSTGLLFSYFENKIRNLLNDNKRIVAFILTFILVLHIVYAFEYNMRAAVRYFYYAFFIIIMAYLFKQIVANLPKRKKIV